MNPSVQYPAVVFSLEMPSWQLMIRLISAIGRVEMDKLNKGNINDEDMMRITSAFNLLNQRGKFLYVDDRGCLTPMQISAEIRKIYREHGGVSMVMIDYLQLMKFPGYENDKHHEISEISGALKRIAKEFDVPVIALSQLNRGLEQRTEKRPMNSDLRESGAIEQDADVIMFIYRDEVYHPDSKDKGLAEVIIGKQRNGPIGTVRLIFEGQYSSFMNYNGMYDQEDVLQ
jgi:replicative DNA helicase